MNNFKFKNNTLHIENISAKNISKKIGTPFYCYSKNSIIEKINEFKKPFEGTNTIICYAVKANPNIAILNILSKFGFGAEVVSKGEIERALKAGISNKKIVFSGVGKTYEEIEYAIKKNIFLINVESLEELNLISKISKKLNKKVQLGIRINPNIDAQTHEKITTGTSSNKFGIDIKSVEQVFKKQKYSAKIEIVALSIHIGSQIVTMKPFIKAFSRLKKLVKKINGNKRTLIKYLDLGGGIGVKYNKERTIPFNSYAKEALKITKELNCHLILEPGRHLIANSGILVTKVLFVKKSAKINFAIIDTGMNDLMRPALYNSYHQIQRIEKKTNKKIPYTIVGPICESADTFTNKSLLNKLKSNDLLFIKNVGAYGASMSSNYNSRSIIPEIIVHKNKFGIIRHKETPIQQINKEKIPSWLFKS